MTATPFKLFQDDELIVKVRPPISPEALLMQAGLFFLKDICFILDLRPLGVADHARTLEASGRDPYKVMGVRKIWNHWYVRMRVFAPYYLSHLKRNIQRVKPEWDANTLLAQKGEFLLSQVCTCIPFSSNQLRHQARKTAVDVCGIYKNEDGIYLVQMETFGPWLRRLWQEGFGHHPATKTVAKKKPSRTGKRKCCDLK